MATVLVTDGEQRSALAIVRSLGRAGHHCVVMSASGRSLAGGSRFAARDFPAPPAGADPDGFARTLQQLVADVHADLVLPVTEEAVLATLAHRNAIEAIVPFPELATFEQVCDKERVLSVARSVGIRVPRQTVIPSRGAGEKVDLPVVLKPTRSVHTGADGARARTSVTWAETPAGYAAALAAYPDAAFPVLAQELITGPGIGVFLLLHEGRVVARFSHRRLFEKPPRGGVSVLSQAEPMDEALYHSSVRLLEALDWSGVAMVEYKRDDATGEHVLMEINGRFWGSLQLAIDAGVDFPRLLVDLALGKPVTPVLHYAAAKTRWEWGHVDHLLARCRRGPARSRLQAVGQWLATMGPGTRNEVLRMSDPRPFLRETIQWFSNVAGRTGRR